VSRRSAPWLAGGAAAGLALGWWLLPTDARRIRAATRELAADVSIPPNEPDLRRVTRVAALARRIAPDVIVELAGEHDPLSGRDAVVTFVRGLPASPAGLTVTVGDIDVTLDGTAGTATARTVATVSRPAPGGDAERIDAREVTLGWSRRDHGWLLSRVVLGQPIVQAVP
jgi:hypothetical protein